MTKDVSVLQHLMLSREMYVLLYSISCCLWTFLFYSSLCCPWACVCPTAACVAPGRICSTSPKLLLHLCKYVSVFKELLCCIWTCICTRSVPHLIVSSCAAPGCVCLKSLCCTWRCMVYKKFFRFVAVCFETTIFVSVVSIEVQKTRSKHNVLFLFHETCRKIAESD